MTVALLSALLLTVTSAPSSPPTPPESDDPPASPPPAAVVAPPEAGERTAPNNVFFEALGSGLLYSLNYERMFEKLHIGLRAGASYFTYAVSSYGRSGNLTLVSFPLLASYYVGWRSHHLQLGLGATILYTGAASDSQGTSFDAERSGAGLAASGIVGYRFMPRDGGVSFGIGFTPLVRTSKFLPWGGANIGYAF
ncbi:MAG: hypothetical protein JWP87_1853 [Labilithrix sp.]|nr:hypothetical protein [Labilithrix sp.]